MIVERDIETQAQHWQADGKPKNVESLLQGAKLAKAEDYLNKYGDLGMLDGVAEDYINVSRQQDKHRRRRQQLTIGGVIGVVSIAAVVATFFGLESRKQATLASRTGRHWQACEKRQPMLNYSSPWEEQPHSFKPSKQPETVKPPSELS
jgi:hypothetical protein